MFDFSIFNNEDHPKENNSHYIMLGKIYLLIWIIISNI